MERSKGKITIRFDFSGHDEGEQVGVWFRDIARDGTLETYIQALWNCGNAVGYYEGKRISARVKQTRETYAERLAAAKVNHEI